MTETTLIHINLASGFGGGEVQTLSLIEQLSTSYRQVVIGKTKKPFLDKVSQLSQKASNVSIVSFWQAVSIARREKRVVIHAHDGRGAHMARLIALCSGAPYIVSRRVDKPVKGHLSKGTYQHAASVIAISQKVASNLFGLTNNIQIIHDSYSKLPENPEVEAKLEALSDKFLVTQLGSLISLKNVDFTIAVAREIEDSHPDIHFLIVGSGKEEEALKEQASGLSNVTFFGFTPYVASVLKQSKLLLMPSKSEGLGSSVLEAYQHDVPVIVSDKGGLPEIVEQGRTGYVVDIDQGNTEYKKRIIELYSDTNKHQGMREYIQKAKQKYGPENMSQSHNLLYQSIID